MFPTHWLAAGSRHGGLVAQWNPPPLFDPRLQPEAKGELSTERITQSIRQSFTEEQCLTNATDADAPAEPNEKDMKPANEHKPVHIPLQPVIEFESTSCVFKFQ